MVTHQDQLGGSPDSVATYASTAIDPYIYTQRWRTADTTSNAAPPPSTSQNDANSGPPSEPEPSDSSEDEAPGPNRPNRTEDVSAFFAAPVNRGPKGVEKKFRKCRACVSEKFLVNEVTTLRRHLQAQHKARKRAAEEAKQTTLDDHVQHIEPNAPTLKYSDTLFREAAEEWLIETNQPLSALDHPRFHHMIDIASRATNGVKIPTRQATRESIISRFKKNISELANKFNSDAVKGEISLTCDAWQAGNRDAYFAVTGHWVEEVKPSDWQLKSALLGFTQMNSAHNGARLGRALYDIAKRYRIQHKIGWVTCDNASNNTTMLKDFETRINNSKRRKEAKVEPWKRQSRHIRCLAHIVNLATQAFLSTYSKTEHLNTDSADAAVDAALKDLADITLQLDRDEIGLIRLIAVKARSSAKRNALLKLLQEKDEVKIPLTLILDMKVRWSSTFAMLERAVKLKPYINEFILKISLEESNAEKQRALRELCVSDEEWVRVQEVLKLLKHADNAQHAFSSQTEPALSHALPALEVLHKTWKNLSEKAKYFRYHEALQAGLEKIATYYNKTSSVNAYNMSMILDPGLKTQYFAKNWGEALELETRKVTEDIFRKRWEQLNKPLPTPSTSSTRPLAPSTSRSRLQAEDSDDESEATAPTATPVVEKPWMKEFMRYLDGDDELEEGQSVVAWWGVHCRRLPTWASLARDYLAIMASSVSSERAFSAAGITISKRRGSLKGDIVEALQVLKSLINSNLIFREPDPTAAWEFENECEEDDGDPDYLLGASELIEQSANLTLEYLNSPKMHELNDTPLHLHHQHLETMKERLQICNIPRLVQGLEKAQQKTEHVPPPQGLLRSGDFAHPRDVTPTIAMLFRAIRLTVLKELHKRMEKSGCEEVTEMDELRPYVQSHQTTTFADLTSLQKFATRIVMATLSFPKVLFPDRSDGNYDNMRFEGEPISVQQLQKIYAHLQDKLMDLWQNSILMGCILRVNYGTLSDVLSSTKAGDCLLDNPSNPFSKHFNDLWNIILNTPALFKRFMKKTPAGDWQLDKHQVEKWLKDLAELELYLLLCVEMTTIIRQYSKNSNNKQMDGMIPSAPSAFCQDLLLQLYSIARPLAVFFALQIYPTKPEIARNYHEMMFMGYQHEFDSCWVSKRMAAITEPFLGWSLTVSSHRHVNIAFTGHKCKGLINAALEREVMSEIHSLQSGHTSSTERRIYGLDHDSLAGLSEDLIVLYLDASAQHQRAFGIIPSGKGLPYFKARMADFVPGKDKVSPRAGGPLGAGDSSLIINMLSDLKLAAEKSAQRQEALAQEVADLKTQISSYQASALVQEWPATAHQDWQDHGEPWDHPMVEPTTDHQATRGSNSAEFSQGLSPQVDLGVGTSDVADLGTSTTTPVTSALPQGCTAMDFDRPIDSEPHTPPAPVSCPIADNVTPQQLSGDPVCASLSMLAQLRKLYGPQASWRSSEQREAVDQVLRVERDVIVALPTGIGKSIIAILPSQVEQGITVIVISLTALVEDWKRRLTSFKIEFEHFEGAEGPDLVGGANIILVSSDVLCDLSLTSATTTSWIMT
ncbi:hypothetical protein NMY22_g9922 [Coprinellus aureogranulatus]|nr:hypothetical protein NMY22_g9922 [Coprinellus aureogranulatus]